MHTFAEKAIFSIIFYEDRRVRSGQHQSNSFLSVWHLKCAVFEMKKKSVHLKTDGVV